MAKGRGEQWSLYLGGENVGCNERSELHRELKTQEVQCATLIAPYSDIFMNSFQHIFWCDTWPPLLIHSYAQDIAAARSRVRQPK